MMNRRYAPLIIAALFLAAYPFAAYAQTSAADSSAPRAMLVYADNPDAVEIIDAVGIGRFASIGDEIRGGETVKTLASSAEIKLTPNGSIVKVARNTSFKVTGLAGAAGGGDTNEFALIGGKIRTVAARSKAGNKYLIRTPSAVCGVRGTDFTLTSIPGQKDSVLVRKGLVEFSRVGADGRLQALMVSAGQFADAMAQSFAAAPFTPEQLAEEISDVEFTAADPEAVPQDIEEPAPAAEEEKKPEEPAAEEAAPEAEPEPARTPAPPAASARSVEKPKAADKAAGESKFMSWLGEILGLEIGSVVIDGNTYSKAVLQPTFSIGKLRMSLYLPVIYTTDVFDPDTWYRPKNGNDEWSFGSESWGDDPRDAAYDAMRDLALKIRYIEYGDQAFDPFYLKVGNLSSMTIGHGVIMRNFANDSDFPAIRRVGFNAGLDMGWFGLEGVLNDLAEPEIYGGRVKFLKIFGVSLIADVDPAGDLPDSEAEALGDPMFLGTGLDIDLPLARGPAFGLRAFADVAAIIPYTRSVITDGLGNQVDEGLQIDSVYDPDAGSGLDAYNNYGFVTGFIGKAAALDWRLEYRFYRGAYRPTFFNASYERNRTVYAEDFKDMLLSPASTEKVMGIYGEAGFSLLRERLAFNLGYMMPWRVEGSSDEDVMKGDFFQAKLLVKKGLIPILDLSGSFSYERTGFVYALTTDDEGVDLLDANTVLKGEVIYPIASNVDLAVVISTASSGFDDNGNPEVEPTVTFETRIRF